MTASDHARPGQPLQLAGCGESFHHGGEPNTALTAIRLRLQLNSFLA